MFAGIMEGEMRKGWKRRKRVAYKDQRKIPGTGSVGVTEPANR